MGNLNKMNTVWLFSHWDICNEVEFRNPDLYTKEHELAEKLYGTKDSVNKHKGFDVNLE